ncbi:YoaK family protein [Devosia sp.]|uniref:YoaK family protein n=1 Tax=Devosia sp. TaxID=1871048 RepID=UPI002FC5E5B1
MTDTILGVVLAFIAGAINAGGLLAIGQYTSHMTGIVSAVADNLALGLFGVVGAGIIALIAFTAGAGCSAVLINWGRRNARTRQYAYPIALEALLLLAFGVLGTASRDAPQFMVLAAPLLCFIMGLQNATITKISGARMRTTHLTGMVTDIGIELGKYLYWHRDKTKAEALRVTADRKKLGILLRVVGMFFLGGVVGALGFGHLGYVFSIPLAGILMVMAVPRLVSDAVGRAPGA